LLTEPSSKESAPELSFVAGLALHDALAECAPQIGPGLGLKWPNDLLLGGKKLAGILIEGESDPDFAVVIGFGVNSTDHPDGTRYPATDLKAAGAVVSPEQVIQALAAAMRRRLAQWRRGEGFSSIRADWLKRAAGLGKTIEVRLSDKELSGVFEGIDEGGRLLLAGPGGRVTVTAGEVFGLEQG
jgi:BirA family biotin operon repressor/biotin-[acetyl-CoA-carboxylase] ligase